MKINKNAFILWSYNSFCQSKFSCKRSKIQKIQKSTPPSVPYTSGIHKYTRELESFPGFICHRVFSGKSGAGTLNNLAARLKKKMCYSKS
jgi:hypothetical protein